MPIKLTYTSVQPTHYTHRKWWWTAQNISFFACFWSFLGLFLRKTRTARFGHLLISLACYIIKYECLKKIIGYGKVQAKSKIWQKTPLFRGVWRGSSSPTHWKKSPSAADYALRRINWPSNTSKGYNKPLYVKIAHSRGLFVIRNGQFCISDTHCIGEKAFIYLLREKHLT